MLNLILIIIGFVFLIKGADILINGSKNIAQKLKISEFIVGFTIVAIGTSLPELIVSINSMLKNHSDLLISNIIGSCIYNLLLILGILLIIKPVKIGEKENTNLLLLLLSTVTVGILGNINLTLNRIEGIFLILIFLIFLLGIFVKKENIKENKTTQTNTSLLKSIFKILIGILLVKYGGDFVVDNSIELAIKLEVTEKVIGLTIIAFGTSLPELVTSIIAIKNNSSDIALGNIIGSNIFNLLLVLGITSIIKPISFQKEYNIYFILLVIISIAFYIYNLLKKTSKIGRKEGIVLVSIFLIYNIIIFIY